MPLSNELMELALATIRGYYETHQQARRRMFPDSTSTKHCPMCSNAEAFFVAIGEQPKRGEL